MTLHAKNRAAWRSASSIGFLALLAMSSSTQAQTAPADTAEKAAAEHEYQNIDGAADRIVKEQPGTPKAQAMIQAAKKSASDALAEKSGDEKVAYAASVYFGFRAANVRARPDLCAEQGVGISSFVTAFERLNAEATVKARTIWAASNIDEDGDYRTLEPQLRKAVQMDMDGVVKVRKLQTLKEACEFVAAHGPQIANSLLFSKSLPDAYKSLMGSP